MDKDNNLPRTKAEAKATGSRHYFTGRPCKSGHIEKRWAHNSVCEGCLRVSRDRWLEAHPEKAREYSASFKARHPEVQAAYERRRWAEEKAAGSPKNKDYYARNKDRESARRRAYRLANLDAEKTRSREGSKRFRALYPGKTSLWDARKRARRAAACPAWLTAEHVAAIEAVYADARARGPDWHVDHIAPLAGKTFCGLHVPWNLRVIPKEENLSKRNKAPPPEDWVARR